jgi:hypothetical protein
VTLKDTVVESENESTSPKLNQTKNSSDRNDHLYKKGFIFVLAIFVISRIIYWQVGIRFDPTPVFWFWQYLDPYLLRHNLLQSVFYQHTQPPLLNLFIGFVMKSFPGHEIFFLNIFFVLCGLSICITMFFLFRRLRVHPVIGLGLTVMFLISPSSILYENWLYSTYPVMTLLCLSCFFLHRFLTDSERSGIIFFSLLALIVLTRSTYQVLWFLLITAGMLHLCKNIRKNIIRAAIFPFIVLLLLCTKNFMVFGNFSTTSWLGMGLFRVAVLKVPEELKLQLIQQHQLSEVANHFPYSVVQTYPVALRTVALTNVAVLDQKVKTTGFNNYNHSSYVLLSRFYLKDAKYLISHYPGYYLRGFLSSIEVFLRSSSDYSFLRVNSSRIQLWNNLFDRIFYLKLAETFNGVCLVIAVGIPCVIAYCLFALRRKSVLPDSHQNMILFLFFNVLYVFVTANAFEYSENNRYRFEIDPFLLLLVGVFLTEMKELVHRRI